MRRGAPLYLFLRPHIYRYIMTTEKMTREKKAGIAAIVLSALYALEFFGTGILIFANMYYTFAAMPYLLSVIALLPLLFSILNFTLFKRQKIAILLICATLIMASGHFLFTAYVLSKLTFVLITCLPLFGVLAIVALFLYLILLYPRLNKRDKKISVITLSIVIFFASVFGIFRLGFFYFTSDGVVFAVEDEYQIAWSTSVKSTGYVTIGDDVFYDGGAGENDVSTLHKVTVPMDLLDEAKEYTIHSAPVYSEAAYLSISGGERTKTYNFRPADSSDGLQIYNISDNHECVSGAGDAGKYFGDKLDVLILNGDHINDVSSLWQISMIYQLASRVTEGTRPVIFVRGNHECNGKYAAELPEYVGSNNGNLYYTVRLGGAYFMVLDTNNDMSDDNFLIAPAANFEQLRKKQTEWLEGTTDFGEDCEYRFLLAHMAFALSDYERFPEWRDELVAATDGKFDLCISGHSHVLDYAEAKTDTRTSYPVIRGSLRSDSRTSGESVWPGHFTGTAIECKGGKITARFTNSKGDVLAEFAIK